MKNEKWVKARTLKKGDKIQFPRPQTVQTVTQANMHDTVISFGKHKKLTMPNQSFIALISDDTTELPDMPDTDEILERIAVLIQQKGLIEMDPIDAMYWLVENQVFDVSQLIELTNDLGPFITPDMRKCRVCGCTDDDGSQCIEASGGPCWWVEKNLCSRCKQEATDQAWRDQWDGDANPPMILTPPSIAINDAAPAFNCDILCPNYPHCQCVSDDDFHKMEAETE